MSKVFTATGWRSGSAGQPRGQTYGIRFGVVGRRLVQGRPSALTMELVAGPELVVPITPGFWKKCPEVRHREIGVWLRAQGRSLPWSIGDTPQFRVTCTATNRFRVELL